MSNRNWKISEWGVFEEADKRIANSNSTNVAALQQ